MSRLDSIGELLNERLESLERSREEGELVITTENAVGEIDKAEFIMENQELILEALSRLRELDLDEREIRTLMLESVLKNQISANAVEDIAEGIMDYDLVDDDDLERYHHFCESRDREITAEMILIFGLDGLHLEMTGESIKDEVIEEADNLLNYFNESEMDDFDPDEEDWEDDDDDDVFDDDDDDDF